MSATCVANRPYIHNMHYTNMSNCVSMCMLFRSRLRAFSFSFVQVRSCHVIDLRVFLFKDFV
nr:unknown protein [Arabidopsis thaliana]